MKLLYKRKVNFCDLLMCPLQGGFPIVSFIRGSTVLNMIAEWFKGCEVYIPSLLLFVHEVFCYILLSLDCCLLCNSTAWILYTL